MYRPKANQEKRKKDKTKKKVHHERKTSFILIYFKGIVENISSLFYYPDGTNYRSPKYHRKRILFLLFFFFDKFLMYILWRDKKFPKEIYGVLDLRKYWFSMIPGNKMQKLQKLQRFTKKKLQQTMLKFALIIVR